MESLDGLYQRLGEIGQLSLETSDTLTTLVGEFGSVGAIVCHRAFDELTNSPIVTIGILPVVLTVNGRSLSESLTTRIATGSCNLLLKVCGNLYDIVHHTGNIGEDGVILTLKDVVGGTAFGLYNESVVDKTFTKGLDDFDFAFDCEVRCDVKHSFVHIICLFGISVNTANYIV